MTTPNFDRLTAAATPGPWRVSNPDDAVVSDAAAFGGEAEVIAPDRETIVCVLKDRRLLCALRNAGPALVEALKLTNGNEHPADERGPCLCSQCEAGPPACWVGRRQRGKRP